MIEELTAVVSQAARLQSLAESAGIPLDWRLGAFVLASWLMGEASRRVTCRGGRLALAAALAAWKWAATERPLPPDEQALLDEIRGGTFSEAVQFGRNTIGFCVVSKDGRKVANRSIDGRTATVWVDGECVTLALSGRALRKIYAAVDSKKDEHDRTEESLKLEAAQAKLAELRRPKQHQPSEGRGDSPPLSEVSINWPVIHNAPK